MILLVMTIFAIQQYFEHIWNEAVYEKVLAPPSELLHEVRGRDDWNLTHYLYMDKTTGQVRIPVDQAMELVLKDAAAGKTFYPAKATRSEERGAGGPVPGAPALRARRCSGGHNHSGLRQRLQKRSNEQASPIRDARSWRCPCSAQPQARPLGRPRRAARRVRSRPCSKAWGLKNTLAVRST